MLELLPSATAGNVVSFLLDVTPPLLLETTASLAGNAASLVRHRRCCVVEQVGTPRGLFQGPRHSSQAQEQRR